MASPTDSMAARTCISRLQGLDSRGTIEGDRSVAFANRTLQRLRGHAFQDCKGLTRAAPYKDMGPLPSPIEPFSENCLDQALVWILADEYGERTRGAAEARQVRDVLQSGFGHPATLGELPITSIVRRTESARLKWVSVI
jgi:hypothetical protein